MTFEEQNQIRKMLENVNKDYLLTLLITQMGQNHGYDYEKMLTATSEFLQAVNETEDKYS
ncbi:hypothetical protein ACQKNX_24605 [Lysinibacillus sp. NPDC093712]|uniref:hypothetical protein n=1 Tax=Lysinibacillus sp. NPDC093712 TaxID=3390579 RepID=UPI003D011CFB